jgi:hypothetical protein
VRYYARVSGFALMLTSAYPGGLFGDQPSPAYDPTAQYPGAAPPPPGYGPPPDPWTLVLSRGARRLVGWFLVIGVVLLIGGAVGGAFAGNGAASNVNKAIALVDLRTAVAPLNQALSDDSTKARACGQNVSCVTRVDASLASSYSTFASAVSSISVPSGTATTQAASIVTEANTLASIYTQLGHATSASQYSSIVNSSGVQGHFNALSADYNKLQATLGG